MFKKTVTLTFLLVLVLGAAGFANSQSSQPVIVSLSGNQGDGGYYVSCVMATLRSSIPGAAGIEYSIDGGQTWKPYNESFELCKTTLVMYRSRQRTEAAQEPQTVVVYIDMKPPAITATLSPAANASGWNNSNVTVSFNCSDMISGIQKCSSPVTLMSEGETQSVTGTAVDKAGNAATTSVSVKIDKTPPKIIITGSREGEKYAFCNLPVPSRLVTDELSGVKSGREDYDGGNEKKTGNFTYAVTATDNAGNIAIERVKYKGIYAFEGFQNPVAYRKPFVLGSTIPVSFVLTDGCNNPVSTATATLAVQRVSREAPAGEPIDTASILADKGDAFWYDFMTGQYIYKLATDNLSAGTWKITVYLDDGMSYSIPIGIK